jgi:CubicO group peptidase (beta-lactamase class C family)
MTPNLHHCFRFAPATPFACSITPLLLCALSVLCGSITHAQTAAPDRFQQLDKNGDGKLTQEEFPYPYFFKKHDKDGDGMLSRDEAAEIKAAGGKPTTTPSTPAAPATSPSATPAASTDFKPRPHGEEATKAGLKPEVLAKLDIALQQAVANKEVSGVISLVHHNGERGYFEAFGSQDIEAQKPLEKDALFRLQSMTKPVIAACTMALFDEGLFTLDEPISTHCPEWAEPKVLENGQLVPAKFAITPRMLMSHSSGLYYGDIEKGALSKKGNEGAIFTPVATTSRDAKTTLKSFSEGLAKAPLKFHPGTGYQYGHSIDVLGRYLEAVAGKPLDVVLQDRILGPLKMTSTDFWVHPENAARICQIYTQPQPGVLRRGREASQLTEKPTLFLGGQGLISSTEDYERFCRMMMNRGELDGVRLLKAESVDLMFQNHLKPELGQKYGLGGAVDGEGGYSWGGANGTQFWLDRTNQLFGIFMVQTQLYKAPTYGTFKVLANESAGIASTGGMGAQGQGGAGTMSSQFKQRDTDADGKLSRDELPAALFDRVDADKDGFVTGEELKALRKPN